MFQNDRNPETVLTAYLECALWCSLDGSTASGGVPLDRNYAIVDFTAQAIRVAKSDIRAFLKLIASVDSSDWDDEQLGHDFWLTRNRHGTGFWDRDFAADTICQTLTRHAHSFGETYLYTTSRGKIGVA